MEMLICKKNARSTIEKSDNNNFISIASIWEIAIKKSLGKLSLDIKIEDFKSEIIKNNFEILHLDFEHIIELSKLEGVHKDPFDRIIISQASAEKYIIITKDINFGFYNQVKIYW